MSDHRTPDVFDMIADVVRAREAPWRRQAACRMSSTSTFYPSKASGPGSSLPAKLICRQCEVQEECEEEWGSMPGPMRNHGVWFGTVERERRGHAAELEESLPSTCTDLLPSYTLILVGTATSGSGGEWVRTPHRFEEVPSTRETTDALRVHTGALGPGG